MTLKINSFREISLPDQTTENLNKTSESLFDESFSGTEKSSAESLDLFGGQMRKLQLLQKFGANEISNSNVVKANYSTRAARVGGDDDEILKETQRLIENYRRQIKPSEIKGAQPVAPGKAPGHTRSKHGLSTENQAEIMNKPDRIFSGINKNGRYVDIYYKDGSAVITEFGNKGRVISGYGKLSTKGGNTPFNIENIAADSKYVEIKLEKLGSTNVIYPNRERFNKNDYPPRPTNPNNPPKTNGGGSNTENPAIKVPNKQTPQIIEETVVTPKTPVLTEPPVTPRAPVIEENLPKTNPIGKLSGNISRGIIVLQLVQLGLTALNFSQLKADGEKFGYYIDPFFDKYVIMDPDKAAQNLPEGFELKFFTEPDDYYSMGKSITFTVKDGKFTNPDGYKLVFSQEKGYVEAILFT